MKNCIQSIDKKLVIKQQMTEIYSKTTCITFIKSKSLFFRSNKVLNIKRAGE